MRGTAMMKLTEVDRDTIVRPVPSLRLVRLCLIFLLADLTSIWTGTISSASATLIATASAVVNSEGTTTTTSDASASDASVPHGTNSSTIPAAVGKEQPQDKPGQVPPESPTQPWACGLYMAESTIPGAGLGIFTGFDREVGDRVGGGDVLIPLVDVYYHLLNSPEYDGENPDSMSDTVDPTANYVWHGPEMGMTRESAFPNTRCTAYCPGLDAAINCNLALINVDKLEPEYDDLGLHRSKDPGAGAFSPYNNSTTFATHPIPAGGELFKFYGDEWFRTREQSFPGLPLSEDYPAAEALAESFDQHIERPLRQRGISSDVHRDLWSLVTSSTTVGTRLGSRTNRALQAADYDQLPLVRARGLRAVYQPSATRALEELERRGRCIDTLKPGISTLPQAGRGAFANRFLRANSTVTGTPLLFAHSGDFLKMYRGYWFDDGEGAAPTDSFRGYQLAMNYAWHHPDAPSLFLLPYGHEVNFINHNRTLANVKLRWAGDGEMGHKQALLKRSPRYMEGRASPGLFVDFVATRDIQEGEEIFMVSMPIVAFFVGCSYVAQ